MPKKKQKNRIADFFKRHPLILIISLCLICFLAIQGTVNSYTEFLNELGFRESTDNYQAINRFGYMGRYQLGGLALQDAGFQDECGNWTELANSHGVFSQEGFLNSPKAQNAAVRAYHQKLCHYIRAYGLEEYRGEKYCGVRITKSGLLAAAHLVGVKNLAKGLASGDAVYDGNGVPASEYMDLFSGYNINKVWKERG